MNQIGSGSASAKALDHLVGVQQEQAFTRCMMNALRPAPINKNPKIYWTIITITQYFLPLVLSFLCSIFFKLFRASLENGLWRMRTPWVLERVLNNFDEGASLIKNKESPLSLKICPLYYRVYSMHQSITNQSLSLETEPLLLWEDALVKIAFPSDWDEGPTRVCVWNIGCSRNPCFSSLLLFFALLCF